MPQNKFRFTPGLNISHLAPKGAAHAMTPDPKTTSALQRSGTTLSPEERELATSLGHEISRTFAVVVAHPEMSFSSGSLADRLKKLCQAKLKGPKATDAQSRAAKLLQADPATRQKHFGQAGVPGSDVNAVLAAGAGLSETLGPKLATAMKARLKSLDKASIDAVSMRLNRFGSRAMLPRTKVETGLFTGDITTPPQTSALIHAPEKRDFRWSTTEAGANEGKWELVRRGPGGRGSVLASGTANGPGSVFHIDLRKWLPPHPPQSGAELYEVRVAAFDHNDNLRIPWRILGDWSLPVTITYAKSTQPDLKFLGAWTFGDIKYIGGHIYFEADSGELGETEQFQVAGFVAETRMDGSQRTQIFKHHKELKLHETMSIGDELRFTLDDSEDSYPIIYTLFMSVMEIDSGDSGDIAEWVDRIFTCAATPASQDPLGATARATCSWVSRGAYAAPR